MLAIGTVVENKYRIKELLGKGGWGSVYLAEHLQLGTLWAIKEIELNSPGRVNLLAEPDILKKLNHPALPRIIDIFQSPDFLYIVEDYFPGTSLKELIKDRQACNEEQGLVWGYQLAQILKYLHTQQPNPIIYRDLKPANVIIDAQGNARLIDFGVAREYKPEQDEDTVYIGTRGYAAPEQYAASVQTDARTDIYGLGATLYHVLTGVSPNQHPAPLAPIRQLNPDISAELAGIINKCLATDPLDRYQTAEQLMAQLDILRTGKQQASGLFRQRRAQKQDAPQVVVLERPVGPIVIGVAGTSRGVGCTHLALTIGTFLSRRKLKVAVLEWHEHPVFYTLVEADSPSGQLEGSVRLHGLDIFPRHSYQQEKQLLEVLRGGYDYVVLDVGECLQVDSQGVAEPMDNYREMSRANLQILVAGAAIWQLKDLAPYLQTPELWQLVFRTPDPKVFKELQQELAYPVHAAGLQSDPFVLTTELEQMLDKILQRYLPQKNLKNRRFSFWP